MHDRLCESHKHPWIDDKRWGLRFGYISKTLLMASTSQKYGWGRDFSAFATRKDSDIAVTQLLTDSEDETDAFTPPYCRPPTMRLQWDTLDWHSREETHWNTSPIKTLMHSPPADLEARLCQAIPELTPDSNNRHRFCLSPTDRALNNESTSDNHRLALNRNFSYLFNTGPHTEDRSNILVGMRTKAHGLLHFGYLTMGDEHTEFYLSLSSNHLQGEKWLGPYITPIQDDLLTIPDR